MKQSRQEIGILQTFLLRCEKVFLELRGIGFVFWIPFFANYILFGLSVYAKSFSRYYVKTAYVEQCLFFIPMMASWWLLMTFKEYVEEDGHEILILYDKGKIADMILLFLLYTASWYPLWKVYSVCWGDDVMESAGYIYMMILVRCLFYYGISFALLMITKTLTVPFLFVLMYALVSNNLYHVDSQMILTIFNLNDTGYLIGGVVGLVTGCVFLQAMHVKR